MDDHDETCATTLTTLCMRERSVHIAKTTQKHKDKPLKSPEKDRKYEKTISMSKDDIWLSNKKGEKTLKELKE